MMKHEIEIEKGIEIPLKAGPKGCWKPLVDAMEHGDSILVDTPGKVQAALYRVKQRQGYTGVTRKIDENSWRLWLLKKE